MPKYRLTGSDPIILGACINNAVKIYAAKVIAHNVPEDVTKKEFIIRETKALFVLNKKLEQEIGEKYGIQIPE